MAQDQSQDAALARGLPELMQTVPQEIFDDIYDLTFTAQPGIRDLGHIIRDDNGTAFERLYPSQPFLGADTSALLQVDRASRSKFAESYFGGQDVLFLAHSSYGAVAWRQLIEAHHRALIAEPPKEIKARDIYQKILIYSYTAPRTYKRKLLAKLHKMGYSVSHIPVCHQKRLGKAMG